MSRPLFCRYSESGVVIANILLDVAAVRIVSNFVNLPMRVLASSLAVTLNCGLLAISEKHVCMSTYKDLFAASTSPIKNEIQSVRIAPNMDMVLSNFTYTCLNTAVLSRHIGSAVKTISNAVFYIDA